MAEQPPLSRFYVIGYSANDRSFPILAQVLDPRVAGYRVPEDLSACPDKRYPNHVFTGAQPLSGDERVRHTWEILPSPYVPFTRYDDDLGPVQGRRRFVVNSGQEASLERDKKVTYEAREGSAIVSSEIEETWDAGSTDPDLESPFPIKDRDFYDESRGAIQERRQLISTTGDEVATLEKNNGVITQTSYEAYNEYLSFKVVQTYSVNGPQLKRGFYDPSRGAVQEIRQLVPFDEIGAASLQNNNGIITQTSYEVYNEYLSFKVVQTYSVDGPQLIGFATNNEGQLTTVTTQRKGSGNYTPPDPTSTKTVESNREDAESIIERVVDVPEVFPQRVESTEKTITIPDRFLVLNPTSTTSIVVEEDEIVPQLVGNAISQQVEQTGVFTAKTTTRNRSLSTETLSGADYDQTTDTTIPFTEYVSSSIPTTSCEADPIGGGKVVVKEYNVASYRAKLAKISLVFPTRSSIVGVPPILKNFKVEWEFTDSSQDQEGEGAGSGSGNSGSISVSANISSGATVSVVPKFVVEYEEVNTSNVPTTSYFFFLPYPVTLDDILAKTKSQQWPIFKPRAQVITANGQTVKKTVNQSDRKSSSWASESYSESIDLSRGGTTEIQNNFATVAIQSSIGRGFSANINEKKSAQLNSATLKLSVNLPTGAQSLANTIPILTPNSGNILTPAETKKEMVEANYTANYNIPATTPNDVPRSGKYLINSSVEPYKFGMAKVYAEVVDASIFKSS